MSVDACDMVMEKQGHESLISFASIAEQRGRKPRALRPRTVVYGGLLTGIAAAGTILMVARAPFDAAVQRAPGTLYTQDADGTGTKEKKSSFLNKKNAFDYSPMSSCR